MTETDAEEELEPNDAQKAVIKSDDYPMRVLAGAGTGKTFTMVRKIERLLEDGVPPDEILALTFTNKAAESMRTKLVERVGQRAYDIDAYTYHAISHEILTEYAYYADIDPDYDIASELDQLEIIYDVLETVPYNFLDPEVRLPDDDIRYQPGAEGELQDFISELKSAGITPDDVDAYLPDPERLFLFESIVEDIATAANDLDIHWQKARHLDKEGLDDIIRKVGVFRRRIARHREVIGTDGIEGQFRSMLDELVTLCEKLDSLLETNADTIVEGAEGYPKLPGYLFGTYSSNPTGLPELDTLPLEQVRDAVASWQHASDLVAGYRAYEQRLDEEGLLDFDDLVSAVQELLAADETATSLEDRWSYVFCDEFQDTDTAQFDLVSQLVGDGQFFVVGDDDQAIYEWRGANPSNITEDIDEAFDDLVAESLEANYRSREPILELANQAIKDLEGRGSDKELDSTEDRADTETGVVTITESESESEAARLGEAMSRLQAGETPGVDESYEYGEMAVLVRDRHHARDLIDELEEREIPFELAGSLAAYSRGVETVFAFLRAIADPTDELSLHRVLLHRYRLPESDLEHLHRQEEPLARALTGTALNDFARPDRIEAARNHFKHLWSVRETYSLSGLYDELKQTTNIEWFLTEEERQELTYLDDLVRGFADGPVEPSLNEQFLDHLRYSATTVLDSGGAIDQPESSDDAVTIMTVHKSKGLEFPVVVMPHLTESAWDVDGRSYAALRDAIESDDDHYRDFRLQEEREERRVFHVGVTRAEDLLLLSGAGDGGETDTAAADVSTDEIRELFREDGPLRASSPSFPVWETVDEAVPESAVDWTELTEPNAESVYDGEQGADEAITRVNALLRQAVRGELPAASPTALDLPPDALAEAKSPRVLRTHSYTAIDRYEHCPRWHYLSNVAYAYEDTPPFASTLSDQVTGTSRTYSKTTVGDVFHKTAEIAARENATTEREWLEIAKNKARDGSDELAVIKDCIRNYHESELSEWTLVASERYFRLTLDDDPTIERPLIIEGYIDAIYRHKGKYYVVDYKTGDEAQKHRIQAEIYTLACREKWDYDIDEARIFYVQDDTQKIFPADSLGVDTLKDKIRAKVQQLNESSFDDPNPDDHCQYCPHRNLPCSTLHAESD